MHANGQQQDDERAAVVRGYRRIEALVPPHWTEQSIEANGIRQHCYRTGGVKPVLLSLHGFMESGLCWLRAAKALEADYDVILLDARGHGRSDGIATGFTTESLVADVAAFIRALGLERPTVLGSSQGGATAARLAAEYPDLARAILLEDPPWRRAAGMSPAASPAYQAWFEAYLAWLEALRTLPHAERMVAALAQLPPGGPLWPEDDYVPWVEACAEVDLNLARVSPTLWSGPDSGIAEVTPRVTCPMLYMRATRPVLGGSAPYAQEAIPAQRNLTVVPFAASHLIRREAFERFIAVVRAFLAGNDANATA